MKRFGRIMLCFLPALLAFGLQQLISIPAVGLALLGGFYTKGATSIDDCMDAFLNIISTANFNAGVSAAYGTVALVVFAYWYYKKFRQTEPENVRKPFNIPVIFGILITAVGLQYITNYIVSFTAAINPHWLEYYSNLVESVGLDEPSLILVLYSVLIGPVCEELIFRGLTLKYAKRAMPFWVANLLQALLFGVFHMNMIQGVYAFVVGIVLGFICEKSHSIYPSMLFHILFNIWGTFSPDWFMYKADTVPFFFLWFFVGAGLLVAGLLLFFFGVNKKYPKIENSYYS